MTALPSGTVTFLFTDLEGSTRLWEEQSDAMHDALARHDEIVREAIEANEGHVVKTTGDGFHAVFASAHDAINAAMMAQLAIEEEPWPDAAPLRVRMGVHTGEAAQRAGDYYGSTTNRAARLMGAGHGGQIVVSGATVSVVGSELPAGVELVALGEHRLRDLAAPIAIFQLAAPGLAREFPTLQSLDAYPSNLPAQLSAFIGRERDIGEIANLLREARIVTLTGVGGVGKTRLALQVAEEVLPRFRDGAWLVELARLRDPDALPEAVGTALGSPNRAGAPTIRTLTDFLRTKQLLLVLDNCEHLLNAAADLVRTLEQTCPNLVVLATSREGLGIRGERFAAVRSLSDAESVQLFAGRAVAVKGDFELTDANAAPVAEVCRRLDGIPLAIELAAARVAVLSPVQLAQRLDQRFRLLAGGERGAIERHATLRAAIDWSYDLLTTEEQLMLARLSVFAGGCTLEAAEAVCAGGAIAPEDVLDLLSALVGRSLVVADTTGSGDARYRLLETIRQYAEENLAMNEREATRSRHARYHAAWEVAALEGLQSPGQLDWFARLDGEIENLRAAVDWAVGRDHQLAFELVEPAYHLPLCFLPAGTAMFDAADRVLDAIRIAESDQLAYAVAMASFAAALRGERDRAHELCNEAFALAHDSDAIAVATAYTTRAQLAFMTGDLGDAVEYHQHEVAWARGYGNAFELASLLGGLAAQLAGNGDVEGARTAAAEAVDVARRVGTPSLLLTPLAALALAAVDSDPGAARAHLLDALAAHESLGYAVAEETALAIMLTVGARLDEPDATLRAGARILHATPSGTLMLGVALECIASAVVARSPESAAMLHGTVDALIPGLADIGPLGTTRTRVTQSIAADIDPESVHRLRDQGARMSELQAAAFARTLIDEALSD